MSRRRFLSLTAVAALVPGRGQAADWRGIGFGAALSLRLVGGAPRQTARAFRKVEQEIARIEATASLHRDSALTRLNRDGHLSHPDTGFLALLALAGQVHHATGGAFDPTVQPLFLATATGGDLAAARALVGWQSVILDAQEVRLAPGQALTLNGIAQGWAADRIAAVLRAEGFDHALIDMGEVQALGRRADGLPWQARVLTPEGRALADLPLSDRALATSAPRGTLIGAGVPHILGPQGQPPLWSTVSVSAPSAALADALSTAFTLLDRPAIDAALAAFPQASLVALA
ncbi:FAD:protein FMN transferase [Rhodobacteraceae bacterium KMS-5]|uniref:FAD:protein FMN transferase n=2 Tax=Tabrizicola oligotrophica TaxID=2710650 RepID=A0A6M0QV76_9RHOB|nr:FAD:protein FMN transferase [Tabrizicola oligotrophica]